MCCKVKAAARRAARGGAAGRRARRAAWRRARRWRCTSPATWPRTAPSWSRSPRATSPPSSARCLLTHTRYTPHHTTPHDIHAATVKMKRKKKGKLYCSLLFYAVTSYNTSRMCEREREKTIERHDQHMSSTCNFITYFLFVNLHNR